MAAIHIQQITDMKPLVQQTRQDSVQLKRYEQTAICSVADLVESNNSPNVIELVHRGERPSVVAMVQLALCEYLELEFGIEDLIGFEYDKRRNMTKISYLGS